MDARDKRGHDGAGGSTRCNKYLVFTMDMTRSPPVMAGLVPAIHVFDATGLERGCAREICDAVRLRASSTRYGETHPALRNRARSRLPKMMGFAAAQPILQAASPQI